MSTNKYNLRFKALAIILFTTCKLLLGEEGKNITFKFEEIEYVKSGKY
jgi:hypothetical protein